VTRLDVSNAGDWLESWAGGTIRLLRVCENMIDIGRIDCKFKMRFLMVPGEVLELYVEQAGCTPFRAVDGGSLRYMTLPLSVIRLLESASSAQQRGSASQS